MRFYPSPHLTVLLSYFLYIITFYGTTSGKLRTEHRNFDNRRPPRSRSSQDNLSTYLFSSRDQCMQVMCPPRNVQPPGRPQPNNAWRLSEGSQLQNFRDTLFNQQEIPDSTPLSYPGLFASFDDIQAIFGNSYTEIRDGSGRVVGVAPSEDGNSANGLSNVGNTGSANGMFDSVFPGLYGGLSSIRSTANPGNLLESGTLQGRFNGDGFEFRATSKSDDDEETGQRDSDVCCQTREVFYVNSTLTDFFGVSRTIAQYKEIGSYQFIRHGVCGSAGLCEGQCVQKLINMPLVIFPTSGSQKVSFSFFKIPGYCTCKVSRFAGR